MDSWNNTVIDWINLPGECKTTSLWICFHDTEITSITSDLAGETVILEMKAFYLPDDLDVYIQFSGVKSVRVNKYPPPYEHLIPEGTSYLERLKIAEGWQSKWREESMNWQEFEEAMGTDPLGVLEADLAEGEGQIALRLGGHLNGEKYNNLWCSVYIRAAKISVSRSDGEDFSLEKLIETGGKWWQSFGEGKED
jgi:hypothetical protein